MATKKLNKEGIHALADDLVRHEKRYNQGTWGRKEACGTVACLAGFCYIAEVGLKAFNKELNQEYGVRSSPYVETGRNRLGINVEDDRIPQIFQSIGQWPTDLVDEYQSNGPRWRVIAALKALQRLKVDGTIDPDPKKVHTKLPQLEVLLAKRTTRK